MPDRRVFIAAFAFLVVIGGSWAGAHFARPLPAPRWTSADLPAAPPDAENVDALLDTVITMPDLDSLLVEEGTDVDELLERARELRIELDGALAPTDELRAEIRRRPRFVEASGMLGRSRVMEAMSIWKLRSLAVLRDVMNDRHEAAAEEVASMWTQALDYANHCRSLLSCTAGQHLLELASGSAELLARRSPHDLRWLARLVEVSTIERSAIENGIIAEYVYARVALESFEAPLLDRAHTDALLADHYATALEFARDPSKPRPVDDFRDSPIWWLYNPAGKRLASGAMVQHLGQLIERHTRRTDELTRRRDALVELLAGRATHGTTRELAGEDPRAMTTLHASEPLGGCEGE